MKINQLTLRITLLVMLTLNLTILSAHLRADTTGTCGGQMITIPFDDVNPASIFFCSIAQAYFSGLTNGTTPTTYSPTDPVPREQMAAFVTRTLDQSLKRGNKRAALGQWWTNKTGNRQHLLTSGHNPRFLACDGLTVWVSNVESNNVSRMDVETGRLICTLSGVPIPQGIVIVSGEVYVASFQSPGRIYTQSVGISADAGMILAASNLGNNPSAITCDGENLWTANQGTAPGNGSISKMSLDSFNATTFTQGFSQPVGILFDGANLWVIDGGNPSFNNAQLLRVDTNTGAVLQGTALSGLTGQAVFDGANLWIPCAAIQQLGVPDKVFVVRAVGGLRGTVLAELRGNGMSVPFTAAFDGERICVTNSLGDSVSLWKASDLSPLGSFPAGLTGYDPRGVCSDGTTFFIGQRSQNGSNGVVTRF